MCLIGAIASLVVRLRYSRGIERQQLKWFVYAATIGVGALMSGSVLGPAFDQRFGSLLWTITPIGLVVAAGVAILRYRLYDIDRLINRTLVYGALTASLAMVYLAGVVSLQRLLAPLAEGSDLAIAGSTLAVAALFRPLRGRFQTAVDRRFYRHRYDAAHTLETFSVRLRQQVALDALSGELRTVVADTMQPAQVSLWLRTPGVRR